MKALILAAGRGERLRPFTKKMAKPALPFLNIPLIGYPLFYLEQAGLKQIAINTHHLPDTIRETTTAIKARSTEFLLSHEANEILGSGGGLAHAISQARAQGWKPDQDLVLVNGDMVAFFEDPKIILRLLEYHRAENALATLVVCPFPNAKENFGGVYVDEANQVRKFSKTELNDSSLKPWHFTGLMVVSQKIWQELPPKPSNLLYEILQPKMDQGAKVTALTIPTLPWFETGNVSDFLSATHASLKLLATPSAHQRTLIRILDRFTPGWWKGWRMSEGQLVLCASPGPELLKVEDFAVVSAETLMGQSVCLKRSVVVGASLLPDHTTIEDRLLLAEDLTAKPQKGTSVANA